MVNTCTIFQRMNAAGDMLRVCTNVENLYGSRGLGLTFPQSTPTARRTPWSPQSCAVKRTLACAFVVKDWCLTAYVPIYDAKRAVIGAVYVGVKQENIPDVRRGISEIVVGKSGYVYVLGGSGEQRGKYIISEKGKRDGESIWEAKDADGRLFIQSLVGKAIASPKGTCDFEMLSVVRPGSYSALAETRGRYVLRALGLGDRRRRLRGRFQALAEFDAALGGLVWWTVVAAFVSLAICGGISLLAGRQLGRAIEGLVGEMGTLTKAAVAGQLQTAGTQKW